MSIKKIIASFLSRKGYVIVRKNKLPEVSGKVFLTELLGKKESWPEFPGFFIEGKEFIQNLKRIESFSLDYVGGNWVCMIEGLKFYINDWEELLILNEIFIEGIYNVELGQPFTFIDIGMNVGITSLFFANNTNCKEVFSFEPFQPTLQWAEKNFCLNKEASRKIKVFEFGLGFPTRTIKVSYSQEYKGSVGINGVASYIDNVNDVQEISLNIVDVYEALKEIETKRKTILKVDCEGAEFEIIKRLNDTSLLTKFDVIMIEWHVKGPAVLKKTLLDNGFEVLSFKEHNTDIGMLYAFKR